jgi:hypothetical protein
VIARDSSIIGPSEDKVIDVSSSGSIFKVVIPVVVTVIYDECVRVVRDAFNNAYLDFIMRDISYFIFDVHRIILLFKS